MCSLYIECVLSIYNVFSLYRICSLYLGQHAETLKDIDVLCGRMCSLLNVFSLSRMCVLLNVFSIDINTAKPSSAMMFYLIERDR